MDPTPPPAPRRTRWKLGFGLTGLLLVATAALIGGRHGFERINSSAVYAKSLARYKAAGGPHDRASLIPAPIPSERNGVDLYLRALRIGSTDFERESKSDGKLSDDDRVLDPMEGEPSEEEWKEIEAAVKERAAQIEDLVAAAAAVEVRYPLRHEDGWSMLMPHITEIVPAGKLLYWDSRCRLKSGVEGSWERIDALLGAANSVAEEPPLVSQMVRMLLTETALLALENALGTSTPPPTWRERLDRRLESKHLENGMRQASLYEIAMMVETVVGYFEGRMPPEMLGRELSGFSLWLSKPQQLQGAARCFDRLLRLQAALDLPLEKRIQESETIDKEFRTDPLSFSFMVAAYPRIWRRHAVLVTRLKLAREALAVRARPSGSVPELGRDPLFDRPITYRRTEKGFLLEVAADSDEIDTRWGIQKPLKWESPPSE